MPTSPDQLPDDVNALKVLLAKQMTRNAQLEAQKQASDQENMRLGAKVLSLQEQLNLALARRYAASSEKLSPDQIYLFDEAEADALADLIEKDGQDEEVEVPAHTRKKRGLSLIHISEPTRPELVSRMPSSA